MKRKSVIEYSIYVLKDKDNYKIVDENYYYNSNRNSNLKQIKVLVFCTIKGTDVLFDGSEMRKYIDKHIPKVYFQRLYPAEVVNKLEAKIGDNQGVLLCYGSKEVCKIFNKEEEIVNHFDEWLKELLIRI